MKKVATAFKNLFYFGVGVQVLNIIVNFSWFYVLLLLTTVSVSGLSVESLKLINELENKKI